MASLPRAFPPRQVLAGLLALPLLLSPALAAEKSGDSHVAAREAWMAGYEKLEGAMKAEEAKDSVLALDLYRKAREAFVQVQTRFPKWNPALLDYRVNYCAERIARLEEAVAARQTALNQPELLSLCRTQADQIKDLTVQNLELKKRLDVTSQALERARIEAARNVNAAAEAAKLLQERDGLRSEQGALQEQVRRLQGEAAQSAENAALKQAAARLEQKLEQASTRKAEAERALVAALQESQDSAARLKQAGVERGKLAAENEALKRDAEAAAMRFETQKQELAACRASLETARTEQANTQRIGAATEKALAEAQDKLKRLADEIAELRAFRDRAIRDAQDTQALREQLEKALKDGGESRARGTRLQEQNAAIVAENEALRRQLAAKATLEMERKAAAAAAAADMQTRLDEAEARGRVRGEERDGLHERLNAALTNVAALKQAVQAAEEAVASQQTAVASEKTRYRDLVQVQAACRKAMERLQQQLAAVGTGPASTVPATDLPLCADPDVQRDLAALDASAQSVLRRLHELATANELLHQQLATRQAPPSSPVVPAPPAADPTPPPEENGLRATIASLREQLQTAANDRQTATDARARAELNATQLQQQLQKTETTTGQLQARIEAAERDRAKLAAEVETLTGKLEQAGKSAKAAQEENGRLLAEETARREQLATALGQAGTALARAQQETKARTEELATRDAALAKAMDQNRDLAARLAGLEADDLPGQLAAARKTVEELREALGQSEKAREAQESALAAAKVRAEDLAGLARLLQAKEKEAQSTVSRNEELQRTLTQTRELLTQAQGALTARTGDLHEAERRLATATTKAEDLERQRREAEREWTAKARAAQEQNEQIRGSLDRLAAAEKETTQLKSTIADQVALLRNQEKSIQELESARNRLRGELQQAQQAAEQQAHRVKELQPRAQVVDGLTATLNDTDKALAMARSQLGEATAETEHARTQVTDLESRLREKEREVARLQEALGAEQAKQNTAGNALLEQLRTVTRELESERARTQSLRSALARQDAAAREPATPAEGAVSDLAEREREHRAQDKAFVVRGFLRQGVTAEEAGNHEAAVWNYRKALEQEPTCKTALQRLGLIAAETGDDDEAIRYLRSAFYADPDDLDTLIPLGFALVRRQQPDLAIAMLARATALQPRNAAVHRHLGVACSSLGWTDAAEAQFRRALTLDAKDSDTAFNLAVLLATKQAGKLDEAKEWYRLARKLGAEPDPGLDQLFGL